MSSKHSLSRKRQRPESSFVEISQGPKRQSSHPPAEIWDNLSKIWLTTGALRELDRRNSSTPRFYDAESTKERGHLQFASEFVCDCSPIRLEEIKSLAESGGPDLTDLRGYPMPLILELLLRAKFSGRFSIRNYWYENYKDKDYNLGPQSELSAAYG